MDSGFFINMKTFSRGKIFTMCDKMIEVNYSKYPRHFRKVEHKYFILFSYYDYTYLVSFTSFSSRSWFSRLLSSGLIKNSSLQHMRASSNPNDWFHSIGSSIKTNIYAYSFLQLLPIERYVTIRGWTLKKIAKRNRNSTGCRESQFYR